MSLPLISVIVPVYQVEKWVERCVRSIVEQSYRHLEIICVDDGSPDRSGAILDALAAEDARIKVIHQPNQGLSAARNAGLAVATGEWVTGVDGDDALAPGIYEAAVPHLTEDVDVLLFGTGLIDEEGRAIGRPNSGYFALPSEGKHAVTPTASTDFNVCFPTKLWRRRIIEEHQLLFPVGQRHEDEAFARLYYPFAAGKVCVLPQTGYLYLQRTGSIMADEKRREAAAVAQQFVTLSAWVRGELEKRACPTPMGECLLSLLWKGAHYVTPADTALCRQLAAMADACCADGVSLSDYRLRYLHHLAAGSLCSPWRRYTPLYAEYAFCRFPLFRIYYREGVADHVETVIGLVRRRLCRALMKG